MLLKAAYPLMKLVHQTLTIKVKDKEMTDQTKGYIVLLVSSKRKLEHIVKEVDNKVNVKEPIN